jgi:hypothetical protein
VAALAILAALLAARCAEPEAGFVRRVPWYGDGLWLEADTHTHTRFTDGKRSVEEVVARASVFGCDVLAITDHGDRDLGATSADYFAEIRHARAIHTEMVLFAGLEWNVPPGDDDDHATVLVPPGAEGSLAEFRDLFDDYRRSDHDPALALRGLRWLADNAVVDGVRPVVILEHPGRRATRSLDAADALRGWRAENDLVVGFSGAPGHQRAEPIGAYAGSVVPIERWDPVVARPGDAWDTLLAAGLDVWGAGVVSDYHAPSKEYHPCEFATTWIYAPERSAAGVLRALRAGSYFGEHGGIVRRARIRVHAAGLDRPAQAGETIETHEGATLLVEVDYELTEEAWDGGPAWIDEVELIRIDGKQATVAARVEPRVGEVPLTHTLPVPPGGIVLRARGRRRLEEGPDLMFYTNPVRVKTRP